MRSFFAISVLLFSLMSTDVCAQGQWTQASILSKGNDFISCPAVSLDGYGNAIAIWAEVEHKGIFASLYDCSLEQWSDALRISDEKEGSQPTIQIDSNGNAIAAWCGEQVQVAFYNAFSKSWSPSEVLLDSPDCFRPSIAIDSEENAVVVWCNKSEKNIQSTSWDAITKTWSPIVNLVPPSSSWLFGSKDYEYAPAPKVVLNQQGHGIAVWIQKNGSYGQIRGACYNSKKQEWTDPFNISRQFALLKEEKLAYGFDVTINEKSEALIVSGQYDSSIGYFISSAEYNVESPPWFFFEDLMDIGSSPRICRNESGSLVLSSIFHAHVIAVLREQGWFPPKKRYFTEEFSIFSDVGIDESGNGILVWNERKNDCFLQKVVHYDPIKKEWSTPHLLSEDGVKNLGATALKVHPKGHAVALWDGYDVAEGKYLMRAAVYQCDR